MEKISFKNSIYKRKGNLRYPVKKIYRYTKSFWRKYEQLTEDIF